MLTPKTIWLDEDTAPVLVYVLSYRDEMGATQPLSLEDTQLDWRMKLPGEDDPDAMLTSEEGEIAMEGNIGRVQLTSSITANPGQYRSRLNVVQEGRVIMSVVNTLIIRNF